MEYFKNYLKIAINIVMTVIIIIGALFLLLHFIGINPVVVESGSMMQDIEAGSLIFVNKNVKFEDIKPNDIITFSVGESKIRVTHRAIKVTEEGIETKGDANNVSDGVSTTKENYEGKMVFYIPKIGYLVKLIQAPKGKIILATSIIVMLLASLFLGKSSKELKEVRNEE